MSPNDIRSISQPKPNPPRSRNKERAFLVMCLVVLVITGWWVYREFFPSWGSGGREQGRIEVKNDLWVLHDSGLPAPLAIDPVDWWGLKGGADSYRYNADQPLTEAPSNVGLLEQLRLHLVWPSLHMSNDKSVCDTPPLGKAFKTIAQPCPALNVFLEARWLKGKKGDNESPAWKRLFHNDVTTETDGNDWIQVLKDDGIIFKRRWLGQKRPRLENDQQQVPFDQRRVIQWSAFYTRGDAFLGWQCDQNILDQQAESVGAWGGDNDLWAVPPDAMDRQTCIKPTQWSLLRPAILGGMRQHVVLWNCPQPIETTPASWSGSDQNCSAQWLWNNHLIELSFQSEPAIHESRTLQPSYSSPASVYTAHLRPRMVEVAWRALEQGLQGNPTPGATTAAARLKQEMDWCEQIQQVLYEVPNPSAGNRLDSELHRVRLRAEYASSSTGHPASACSRAQYRMLAQIAALPPKAEIPAEVMLNIEKMATLTQRESGISNGLHEAVRQKLVHLYGRDSLQVFRWLSRREYYRDPQTVREMLSMYDLHRAALDKLPPQQRLLVRMPLAVALMHQHTFNNAPYQERLPEIYNQAVTDWQAAATGSIPAIDEVELLSDAAMYSRQLSRMSPADADSADIESSILSATAKSRMAELIPLMEDKVKKLLSDKRLTPELQVILASRLAIHAAWTANALAASGEAEWQTWLAEWSDWTNAAFGKQAALMNQTEIAAAEYAGLRPDDMSPALRAAVTIKAVEAHRDAAALNQVTQPNCPGADWLGCSP